MINKLKNLWRNLRTTFWFVPSLIVAGSVGLAAGLVEADAHGGQEWLSRWPRLFGASADGARGMLSTIAGTMMTVVGVVFSMTLVTLALASSQYTSRILRTFMSDRVTQVVLGIFAGIFTYCLIVLRTIRSGDTNAFIPSLAVSFGVLLAVGGISVLILFIHHIASSIQASNIIASVAAETIQAVDRSFPEKLGEEPIEDEEERSPPLLSGQKWWPVAVPKNGYIQNVDNDSLLRVAREHGSVVRMERGVGEFVVQKTTLASLARERAPDDALVAALQSAYTIRRHRTVDQDSAFGIRQIVDVALRALSPGINDTTTAVTCVDYLAAILARLAARPIPSACRYEDEQLRVIARGPNFQSLIAESFDQIRESSKGNVAMMLRMLGALQTIASLTPSPGRRRVVREHVEQIAELGERTLESSSDRARFYSRLATVREALDTKKA